LHDLVAQPGFGTFVIGALFTAQWLSYEAVKHGILPDIDLAKALDQMPVAASISVQRARPTRILFPKPTGEKTGDEEVDNTDNESPSDSDN